NICEVKYSQDEYHLTKDEYDKISNRKRAFIEETGLRHTPWTTLITTLGVAKGQYADMIQSQVTMDDLFM
ncbi:MAG: ATP-binding protein, partial [Prevotella sp.]|nr:ATP-binding protein [Prevotella sp.]